MRVVKRGKYNWSATLMIINCKYLCSFLYIISEAHEWNYTFTRRPSVVGEKNPNMECGLSKAWKFYVYVAKKQVKEKLELKSLMFLETEQHLRTLQPQIGHPCTTSIMSSWLKTFKIIFINAYNPFYLFSRI